MRRPVLLITSLVGLLLAQNHATLAQFLEARAAARTPQLWAIVVGVSGSSDPKLRLQGHPEVMRQAFNVFGWLNRTAGWDRSHLLLLTDFGGSDDPGTVQSPAPNITPTKKNLDWAFRDWLKARARPDDVIVFYFAGQARSVPQKSPTAVPEYYLISSDAHSESLATSGWSLDKGLDLHARQTKDQMICWLATTLRSEPTFRGGETRGLDSVAQSRDWLRRLARWPNVTVWLASDGSPATAPADPAVTFTQTLLAGFGAGEHKQNLSGRLRTLQQSSSLKGFRSIGGVPPRLNCGPGNSAGRTNPLHPR